MGIKFQRIGQDRDKTSGDRRDEQRREQQTGWRFWPLFLTIVLCVGIVGYLYVYMFSSRMVYPGVIQAPVRTISSPVSGTVTEMLSDEVKRVEEGTVIAAVQPDPDDSSGLKARLDDLQLRLKRARSDRRLAEAELDAPEDRAVPRELILKQMSLWQERVRLQGSRESVQQELRQKQNTLKQLQEEQDRVKRLYRLDAATKEEIRNAERRYREGKTEVQSVRQRLEGIDQELHMIGRVLNTTDSEGTSGSNQEPNNARTAEEAPAPLQKLLKRARADYMTELRERLEEAKAREQQLLTSIEDTREMLKGTLPPEPIKAPYAGAVLKRAVKRLDHVREGDTILTLYDRNELYARAYVQPEHRSNLSVGQEVRVYVPGRDAYIKGHIERFSEQLEELPNRTDMRSMVDDTMLLPVEVSLPASAREGLMLNEYCRIMVSGT